VTACAGRTPATFAPLSVTALFETDLTTHQRFRALRAYAVEDAYPVAFVGNDLYLTYGTYSCDRVAKVPLSGGRVVQSPWLALDSLQVAYGAVWVVVNVPHGTSNSAAALVQLSSETLSVERTIAIPSTYNDGELAASDGAIWLPANTGPRLLRVDARSGEQTPVLLPGMAHDLTIGGLVAGSGGSLLYVNGLNQNSARWNQETERFVPATRQFEVVRGTLGFAITGLIGVAGNRLWVSTMGGMVSHAAPISTVTLLPSRCATYGSCTFNGFNGIFSVTTGPNLAWMTHAGGWLECADSSSRFPRATVRIPGFGPITGGYSGNDSAPSPVAARGNYLAVDAQFRSSNPGRTSSELAIFPVDPRC
jgi:hypothetical protein